MADLELSLYDMNKQLVLQNCEVLTEAHLKDEMAGIAAWFSFEKESCYFMLLCHELRDYTIFHFNSSSKKCYDASMELLEVLQNRGEIVNISYEERAYSIWITREEEVEGEAVRAAYLYHLFPYDLGVVEV